ncbi:RNA polymerase sigma factor [Paenibacillus sp. GCM10012306]|uniref:RNA polymerase sigma factor n=1 Tax=Paenibacillus sp. GCM10012306 TaxID=3317342 RepID=UPI0036235D1D
MLDMNATSIQRDYLEKLYYFALKKTGSKHEAEDLAQDIASQALLSLANGSCPDDLSRWIWTIARNRYAHWAKDKKRRSGTVLSEVQIAILPDGQATAEDQLLLRENLALLRRELSLLASGYREMVVAYYFEGVRLADIAKRLSLPEGTVKRKLHECRKNMREGIEMAREVGLRSFKAEDISFSKSGLDGKDGLPWQLIQRLIPKNILLASYRNPLNLEELCLELGISMPYMEEEVKLLVDGTLLKEVKKDHFETDFIIVDREMQRDIFLRMEETSVRFAPLLIELLDAALPELEKVLGKRWERSFIMWTLIPMAVDFLARDVLRGNAVPNEYTKRPHDGQWDIVGCEVYDYPYSIRQGQNGTGNERDSMCFYKIGMHDLWDRAGEMSSYEFSVLASVIRANRKLSELGSVEQEVMRKLEIRCFVDLQEEVFVPNFPVFKQEQFTQFSHLVSLPLYTQLQVAMDVFYKSVYAVIGHDVPARLNEQLKFVSGEFLFNMRMMSLRHALDQGHINLPEDPKKSTIAMYMMLD